MESLQNRLQRNWLWFLLMLCVGIPFTIFGVCGTYFGESETYTGKVMFETEAQYVQFKEAVGSPTVLDFDADILSSSPPIVVKFRVNTDGSPFAYGEKSNLSDLLEWPEKYGLWLGIPLIVVSSILIRRYDLFRD